jgi:16S rRNA (adenine1518-N6/adenine1519-N6)-dimethyltransferase
LRYPKKSLGQNFLIDKNIVKKIISSTKIHNENILEIGPGFGTLTDEIIKKKPKKLILIEKDNELFNKLKIKYSNINLNINIINQDILDFKFEEINNYKIISNLPYNISSRFLLKTLKLNNNILEILCMIQSELADKFNYNKDKNNKYKFINKYCCSNYQILFNVPPTVFHPKPKVNSKVVKFILKKKNIDINLLNHFIEIFFINKRKMIKSNKHLNKKIINKYLNCRYEDLEFLDILNIYKRFNFFVS